jgi:hypothetical protein
MNTKSLTVYGRNVVILDTGNVQIECDGVEEYARIAKYLVREGYVDLDDRVRYPRPPGADF